MIMRPPQQGHGGRCRGAGCQVGIVVLRRRIDHRHWHGDQFSGARDMGLAAGAGE
jgi:hypothetical protein